MCTITVGDIAQFRYEDDYWAPGDLAFVVKVYEDEILVQLRDGQRNCVPVERFVPSEGDTVPDVVLTDHVVWSAVNADASRTDYLKSLTREAVVRSLAEPSGDLTVRLTLAALVVSDARDYGAEGITRAYPLGPGEGQGFDDWAADVLSFALSGTPYPPKPVAPLVTYQVQVGYWQPRGATVTVRASSVEEACALAFEKEHDFEGTDATTPIHVDAVAVAPADPFSGDLEVPEDYRDPQNIEAE